MELLTSLAVVKLVLQARVIITDQLFRVLNRPRWELPRYCPIGMFPHCTASNAMGASSTIKSNSSFLKNNVPLRDHVSVLGSRF